MRQGTTRGDVRGLVRGVGPRISRFKSPPLSLSFQPI